MSRPKLLDLAVLIAEKGFLSDTEGEWIAEAVIAAGWVSPEDVGRLAEIGMNNCDSALDWKDRAEKAEATIARVEALHRPDGGVGGPGSMCVACTSDFGTPAEDPVPWPCATIAALAGDGEVNR